MELKVSVIIPTIGRHSLKNSLESARGQTHKNLEIVVVDDSKEQSVRVDGNILVKTGGAKGPGYSRNMGIRVAQGELVAFLDDDDIWKTEKISKQIRDIYEGDLDVLLSSALVNKRIRPKPNSLLKTGQDPLDLLYSKPHIFRSDCYLPTASYIAKAKIFNDIQFKEGLIDRENLLFLRECFEFGLRMSQSPDALVEVNFTASQSLSRMSIESEQNWYRYLLSINKHYAQNFLVESSRNFIRRRDFIGAKQVLFSSLLIGH